MVGRPTRRKGPVPLSVVARLAATTASTSTEKAGLSCAICTTVSTPGGTSTLSMTWMTPLLAATSVAVTLACVSTSSVSLTPPVVLTPSVAAAPSKV